MLDKTICYLKEGMSICASHYIGQCGRRRGRHMVTIIKEFATCQNCKDILLKGDKKSCLCNRQFIMR